MSGLLSAVPEVALLLIYLALQQASWRPRRPRTFRRRNWLGYWR